MNDVNCDYRNNLAHISLIWTDNMNNMHINIKNISIFTDRSNKNNLTTFIQGQGELKYNTELQVPDKISELSPLNKAQSIHFGS
jgi:hypothetical protein